MRTLRAALPIMLLGILTACAAENPTETMADSAGPVQGGFTMGSGNFAPEDTSAQHTVVGEMEARYDGGFLGGSGNRTVGGEPTTTVSSDSVGVSGGFGAGSGNRGTGPQAGTLGGFLIGSGN